MGRTSEERLMRMMIRRSFCSIVLALALFLIPGHAQRPEAASPAPSLLDRHPGPDVLLAPAAPRKPAHARLRTPQSARLPERTGAAAAPDRAPAARGGRPAAHHPPDRIRRRPLCRGRLSALGPRSAIRSERIFPESLRRCGINPRRFPARCAALFPRARAQPVPHGHHAPAGLVRHAALPAKPQPLPARNRTRRRRSVAVPRGPGFHQPPSASRSRMVPALAARQPVLCGTIASGGAWPRKRWQLVLLQHAMVDNSMLLVEHKHME